jgi:hypothetical protein
LILLFIAIFAFMTELKGDSQESNAGNICKACKPLVEVLLDKIAVLEMKVSILNSSANSSAINDVLTKIKNIDLDPDRDEISHPSVSSIVNFLEGLYLVRVGSVNISILGEYCQNARLPMPSWTWKSALKGSNYEHAGKLSVYSFVN